MDHNCGQEDRLEFLRESIQRIENKIDALFLKHDVVWKDYIEFKAKTETVLHDLTKRRASVTTFMISMISGTVVAIVAMITRFIK